MSPLRIFLHFIFFNFVISAKDGTFVFNGFHDANLSLSGGSYVKDDGILAVTNETSRVLGHAFYPSPLQFKYNSTTSSDAFSFSTAFVFSVRPKYPNLGGHGLAFLFSSSTDLKGALLNQYLGLPNMTSNTNFLNHILAVEFDVVQNLELGDIDDNHVGIDINSLISNVSQPAAYLTGSRQSDKHIIDMKSEVPVQAWVEYSSKEKLLNVTISPFNELPRPSLPLISFPVNLATIFEEYMYVGFSASTGLLTAEHDVLGWSFRINDGPAQDFDPSELPSLSPQSNMVNSKGFAIGIALACTAFVFLGILVSYHLLQRLKNSDEELEDWEVEYGARRYDYSELSTATRGFGDKSLIGSGGFGSVYKGAIPSTGIEVAIKRISHDSRQGIKEFVAEITSVGRLKHRNLVQLQGWCRRGDELLLVYDYVPNGSLDKVLFDPKKQLLTWDQRFNILKGVAQALLYLHEECDQRVVHRDIKSSNILIDADLNAKLGDFGLARIYEHDIHPQTTHIVGTLGYLAPELTRTGKATTSTDVFSYGALALEVACGRRPIEPQGNAFELVLVDWVKELHRRGEVMKSVDPRLDIHGYDRKEMELTLHLGLLCSHPLPCYRPSMRRVVQFLFGDATLPPLPSEIHPENFNLMAEFSDTYVDSSDPSSYRVTSSKSTSSLSSFDGKVIFAAPASRSTY